MSDLSDVIDRLLPMAPWLAAFLQSSDEKLSATAHLAVQEYSANVYDYLSYDTLIGDASVLLDRCLAYRKDYNDLFASAIRQALDFRAYEEGGSTQEELEKAAWISDLKLQEAAGQRIVAAAFQAEGAALADAFASASEESAVLADMYVNREAHRMSLVEERWRIDRKQKNQIRDHFSQQGGPLNYADRAARTLRLMQQDFYEAVQKLLAVRRGIDQSLENDVIDTRNFPVQLDHALDDFVHWTRSMIRSLEHNDQNTSSYEHVISCRGMFADAAEFEQSLLNMTIRIDLSQHPTGINSAVQSFGLVKGVGVSLVLRNPGVLPAPSLMQTTCDVFAPLQRPPAGVAESYFDYRDRVQIDGVRPDDGQPIRYDSSRSLKNTKVAGVWRIDLAHPRYPFGDVGNLLLPPLVHDVRLHLIMSSYTTGGGRPMMLRSDPVRVPVF